MSENPNSTINQYKIIINSLKAQAFYTIFFISLLIFQTFFQTSSNHNSLFIIYLGFCMLFHIAIIFILALISLFGKNYNDLVQLIISFLLVLLIGFASCSLVLKLK